MKIEPLRVTVRELTSGYIDGVRGTYAYDGLLNIRPAYQREFVYKDTQMAAVIRTVKGGWPLNTMYWARTPDGKFEVVDGQQRTVSLCKYIDSEFSVDKYYFHSLTPEEQEKILDYKLNVFVCEGDAREKLEWFRIINVNGEKLNDQELRNAAYAGPWLADARYQFSRRNCPVQQRFGKYLSGNIIRQDYLETFLKWAVDRDGVKDIEEYMAKHQADQDASELCRYADEVIKWTQKMFPVERFNIMKGLPWGLYYNQYSSWTKDPKELELEIQDVLGNSDVTNPKGVYLYVLSGQESCLNLRTFSPADKKRKYDEQKGVCAKCGKYFSFEEMDGDHILPWCRGGRTEYSNLQMLCIPCNRGGAVVSQKEVL